MVHRIKNIIKQYLRSTTVYQDHSPFFYDLWKHVIMIGFPPSYIVLEKARKKLKKDSSVIERLEFGAGSKTLSQKTTIAKIAKTSLSPCWKNKIVSNLIDHYNLENILELGTSLGISSSYMAMARPGCKVTTLEGDPLIAIHAKELHKSLDLTNVNIVVGAFEQTLESVIDQLSGLDLVFIDGNHNGQATLENFEVIKAKLQSHSVVVVDDVFWSNDMIACWNHLINDKTVTASLLYYDLGLLFFNEIFHEPIHINWVDRWLKPWTYIHSI